MKNKKVDVFNLVPAPYPKPYTLAYYKHMLRDIRMFLQLSLITDDEGYSYFKDGWQGVFSTIKTGLLAQPLVYIMEEPKKRKRKCKRKSK